MGSDTAYVVTNFHVIDGCKSELRVRYPVYQPVNAYIHARDPSNDLALLSTKLPASGFPSFRLNLKQGEQIASYGFAYGNDLASFTMGNVTSVVGLDNNTSAFQMSAPVQPGNSGGPLLDMNARVIGMAQGILGTLRAAEALGELFLKTSISVSLLLRLLGFFRLIVSIIELTPREQNLNLNKSLKKPKSSLSK
jgi:S1-C subfamily serine protease